MAEMRAFGLARPPRQVPFSVRLRILLGGPLSQIGWGLFGFGMIFVWVFVCSADFSLVTFRGQIETAQGTATGSEKTSFSEGGSDHSDGTPVYANRYTFTDQDGGQHESVSYATGRELQPGSDVTVEYLARRPTRSRIRGMRRAPMSPVVMFVLLFPLIGLGFVVSGLLRGRRGISLLVRGRQGEGRLVNKEPTNTTINDRRVYKLTFEFTADDGQTQQATAKTHKPESLEDEATELLLYDPFTPTRAVLLDNLPGKPRIDEFGTIRAGSPGSMLLLLILPAVTILGHGAYLLLRYGV